jgi:DNA-binding transcriptional MocR family regulator
MENPAPPQAPRYLQLARAIAGQIKTGTLRVGDKLPSVRALSLERGVSISTVLQAYQWLENQGLIEPHPRSGFYARIPQSQLVPEPSYQSSDPRPIKIGAMPTLGEILRAAMDPEKVSLGASAPSPQLFPATKLNKIIRRVIQEHPDHSSRYIFPPGLEALRREIARRSIEFGCSFTPDEVVITSGGIEAIVLSLRAIARVGDVVAIESPTYFGILQALESLGMRVLEIPAHPRTGMDLAAFERAIKRHKIKACVIMPNCHSPLGYVLSDEVKSATVEMAARHGVALIENDVYRDLAYGERRPKPAKAFDKTGTVVLCSSFSKVLGPGFRVGWVNGGKYKTQIESLKFVGSLATPSLPQLVIAEFLAGGGYERHLRRLRDTLPDHVQAFTHAASKYFPQGSKLTRPAGGYLLWCELPKDVNSDKVFRAALAKNILITPGSIFGTDKKFSHHMRLNAGMLWSTAVERALFELGKLCSSLSG